MRLPASRFALRPDGLPMLMVSVNLLLLSFFVLLNALSSQPTSKVERHSQDVLARVREGYNLKAETPAADGQLPAEALTPWAARVAQGVQGVIINRLRLNADLLTVDASRLVVELPPETLFAGDRFVGKELVQSLQLAAQGASMEWQIAGRMPEILTQGAQLGSLTDKVSLAPGAAKVTLIIRPMLETPPTAARAVENLLPPLRGDMRGEGQP